MPRIVDHDQRRRSIARSFQDQVAERGFGATTYAVVAAAAGISVGTIQHYFANRDELLRFAFDDLLRAQDERVAAVVAAGEADRQTIREIIRSALRELLPLDEERRRTYVVTQQLRTEAWHDTGLRDLALAADRHVHEAVRTAVVNGTACGEVSPDADPDPAASRILATANGLAHQVAAAHLAGRPLLAPAASDLILDPVLATVFTGRCTRHDPPRP